MGTEVSVQLYRQGDYEPHFPERLCFALVALGGRYSAERYGQYSISDPDGAFETVMEDDIHEATERLADILGEFRDRDGANQFSVSLDYPDACFPVTHVFSEREHGSVLTFQAHTADIGGESSFLRFVDLCTDVFDRFGFDHGGFYRDIYDDVPADPDEFLAERIEGLRLYSPALAERVGYDRLRPAPAYQVTELANGGVSVLVCADALGNCPNTDEVNDHLQR